MRLSLQAMTRASPAASARRHFAFVLMLGLLPSGVGVAGPATAPAGVLPTNVSLTLTGAPADAAFVQAQIAVALDRVIRPTLQAGAVVRYGDPVPAVQPLGSGFETSFSVPVTISGSAEFAAVDGAVIVRVANLSVAPFAPVLLHLDDDPEYVRSDGVLFRSSVASERPVRLYYYHENGAQTRRFMLVLTATAANPSRVQIIDASAGPSADVMSVGHAVSRTFVQVQPLGEGVVVDVAAGMPFVQRDVTVGPSEGVAGVVDLRVLAGGAVTMTVLAAGPGADPTALLDAARVAYDGHDRHGTFALTGIGEATVAYTVGGPDASLEYGNPAHGPQNVDPNDRGRDAGDYGVLQRITFDLANPLHAPATVYLYEQPVEGVVRSSFLVNGALVDLGCARLSQRYQIASYQLGPGSAASLRVLSMTDGGSNYPLEVGVTTTPPLPTTPPIDAPDGCFPKPGIAPPPPPPTPAPT
jgi:hypothetical protein